MSELKEAVVSNTIAFRVIGLDPDQTLYRTHRRIRERSRDPDRRWKYPVGRRRPDSGRWRILSSFHRNGTVYLTYIHTGGHSATIDHSGRIGREYH